MAGIIFAKVKIKMPGASVIVSAQHLLKCVCSLKGGRNQSTEATFLKVLSPRGRLMGHWELSHRLSSAYAT